MKRTILLLTYLLLVAGASMKLNAQTAVTVGSQVTAESSIVSGKAYLVYYVGNGNSGYMKDTGSAYTGKDDTNPNERAVYYFTTGSASGTWKVQNYYTGKYWGTPTANANTYIGSDTGGDWALNFQSGNNIAPSCNGHSWNRSGSNIHPWSTGTANVNQFQIYEVALSTTALSDFTDKDVIVSSTAAASLSTGTWYVMSQRSRTSYVYEDVSSHTLKHTRTAPSGSDKANYCVRLVSGTDGKYYLQTGLGNYVGQITASTNVPTTALQQEQLTIDKINSTDGHFYVQSSTGSVVLDANDFTGGDPSTVVGWGTTAPTSTGDNNDWAFYPIELVDSWTPTISEVYTISHANRGSVIYNPDGSTKYVWSSGKSGTFNAAEANSQWVIIPSGTAKQYYLYNVGAGKFAIPTAIAQGSGNPWIFSDNAVPVKFITQSDGTKKIQMATDPVSGTNAAYMAVSNNYTGPIINYNDAGGNFTITLVDGQDQSTAANAAVAKLIKSQTALTTYPQTTGWYAIQIKSKSGSASFAGRYLQIANSLYNDLYPLTFTGGVDVQPAITDPTFFTHIDYTSWNNNDWQLPDGRHLVISGTNKFPTVSSTASAIYTGYDGGNFFKTSSNYYADPYNSGTSYFIGETTSFRTTYYVYPIDLTEAGLTPWLVTITNGSDGMQLTCTRSDVKGLTAVYNNGYFFLPTDVTPSSSDFSLTGMISCTVDATNHTITAVYDPELSITSDDVVVKQGNQVTGKGNTMQALLRIKATPFSDFQPTQFSINLSGADQVDNVKVYSTTSDQIRFAGVTPTLLGTADSPSDGTVYISVTSESVSAGTTLYYWITADVKSTATEWETIDASLSSISYTNSYKAANSLYYTDLDLSSIGNPDGEMRIYKSQNTLWTSSKSNSKYYRIPALLKTGTNTLLAFTDDRYASTSDLGGNHKIDVLVKKSTDGGATWGNAVTVAAGDGSTAAGYGYGDAAVAQAANGDIVCLMAAGNTSYGNGMLHIGYSKSTDGGATWSSPVDIYGSASLTNSHSFQSTFVSSGHGITQTIANTGRIAFPALGKISGTTNEYVIYSVDNGDTWTFTDNYGYTGADESKLLELNDGKLLMSIRCGGFNSSNVARGYNRTTDTNVENWGTQGTWSDLTANGCNSDLIYYTRSTSGGRDVMLHSVVKSYSSHRKDLRLYMSFDEGNTWHEAFQLQPGWAAYSSMQVLDNGDLAILFEDGSIGNEDANDVFDINYVTISKELLEEKIEELDPLPDVVKIAYGTNGHETYGSVSGNTWTSNAASGIAGLTLTKSEGAFATYTNGSFTELGYYLGTTSSSSTLTLTAPNGYVITGYSAKIRQGQSGDASYTLTSEKNTTLSPAYGSYTDWSVSGLSNASTAITVSNTNASNSICIANFVVNLQSAVEYHVVDASGNEMASLRFVPTTNSVEGEMPPSLKRAFCTYAYYSDAACTIPATTIDDKTDIYVRCTINAPFEFSTVENPRWYLIYSHEQGGAGDYYSYADGSTYNSAVSETGDICENQAYWWAFIGNPYNVQLLNKQQDAYLSAAATSAGADRTIISSEITTNTGSYPYNTFSLYGYTNGNVTTTNPFSLVLNGSSYVWVNGADKNLVSETGALLYHSGIHFNENLQIRDWRGANLMVREIVKLNVVGDASYATLYLDYDVTTDGTTKAYYIATTNNGYAQLTATGNEGTEIPANTAVVLVNSNAAEVAVLTTPTSALSSVVSESANLLKGTLVPMSLDLSDGSNYYSLGKKDGAIGFYKFDNGSTTTITLGANKAYLDTTTPANSVKGFTFSFDDANRIVSPLGETEEGASIYNVAGQRLSKPQKGVNIINGKKVVIK